MCDETEINDAFAFYNNKYMESVFIDAEWSDVLFPSLPHNSPGELCPAKMACSSFYQSVVRLIGEWAKKVGFAWSDGVRYCEVGGACGRTFYEMLKAHPEIHEAVLCEPSSLFSYAKTFIMQPASLGQVPVLNNDGSRRSMMMSPEALPAKVGDGVQVVLYPDVASTLRDKYSGSFQLITCLNVVDRHLEPHRLVQELDSMLAPGGLLVLASPMDWTKEFTPGDCIVRDLRKFFDSSWECVGSTDIQYDWRVTSRYAQRFKSQVLCMKKDGGQSGSAQCKAAIDEAVFVEEVFLRKFAIDVGKGLSHPVKTLPSLYFYDDIGSQIYSKITECQDYYLTRVEHSLLTIPANLRAISDLIVSKDSGHGFNLVELGAGDGSKTTLLLNHFLQLGLDFTYRPIDISAGALETLAEKMRAKFNLNGDQPLLPALSMRSLHADNVQGLTALVEDDQKELHAKGLEGSRTNVVLFLGSSIGNMNGNEGAQFLRAINGSLQEDDIMIIGFDLRKDPNLMIAAYSDREGITAEFNYNLLRRINRELGANFQIDQFKHHCTYCPRTSEMQSWLVSQQQQTVTIASLGRSFDFGAWECMQTESSFKYSINQIEEMAARAGFVVNEHLADAAGWMRLSTWTVKKGASVH